MATAPLRTGRVIVPGTGPQLARFGLFPPLPAQAAVIQGSGHQFAAKAEDDDLLWIRFDELCRPEVSRADFAALAARCKLWVVDDVPSPGAADLPSRTRAWIQFAALLEELSSRGATLFVVGRQPLDWAGAAAAASDAGLREVLAAIDRVLACLVRLESDEAVAVEGVSGS